MLISNARPPPPVKGRTPRRQSQVVQREPPDVPRASKVVVRLQGKLGLSVCVCERERERKKQRMCVLL